VTELHRLLGLLVLGLALLSAAWSAGLTVLGRPGGRLFIANLGWTAATALLAAVVGLFRLVSGSGLADPLHLIYGALAVVVLPGFALVGARRSHGQELVILIGTIVLLIVILRLFQTG
jgi:hypothetical protein